MSKIRTSTVVWFPASALLALPGVAQAQENTKYGTSALASVTTGTSNAAFGAGALKLDTTGSLNTATGTSALLNSATADGNTATGAYVLNLNTSGIENTATGLFSMFFNTTGHSNTANGAYALACNSSGQSNVAVGYSSMYTNSTGKENTVVGARAMYLNTTGPNNAAFGFSALYSNTTGGANVAIGSGSMYLNTTGSANTALGAGALSSNVGGNSNVALGGGSLGNNTAGLNNVAVGNGALNGITTSSNNTAVGYNAGPASSLQNTGAFGFGAVPYEDNMVFIGNASTAKIGGPKGWSILSDARLKTNVRANVPGLDFVMKLRPVTFTWDMKKLRSLTGQDRLPESPAMEAANRDKETRPTTGFLAQEVEAAAREVGYDFSGVQKPQNDHSPYMLSYDEFVVPLVSALQEQQKEIERLRKRIDERNGVFHAGFLAEPLSAWLVAFGVAAGLFARQRRKEKQEPRSDA